jgi:hypothetical protein
MTDKDYTNWQNEWPAKGLLQECRRLWKRNAELEAELTLLKSTL